MWFTRNKRTNKPNIKVNIQMLGEKFDFVVPQGTTIGEVKIEIEEQSGSLVRNMELFRDQKDVPSILFKSDTFMSMKKEQEKELKDNFVLPEAENFLLLTLNTNNDNVAIAGEGDHNSLFLDRSGKVYSYNSVNGDIGHPEKETDIMSRDIHLSAYRQIRSLDNKKIISIARGSSHSLFLDEEGIVYSCGNNINGQLGHDNAANAITPTEICYFTQKNICITAIACDSAGTCSLFLDKAGTVYSCGYNNYGQLGHIDIANHVWMPRRIDSFNDPSIHKYSQTRIRIVAFACGGFDKNGVLKGSHSLFLDETGTVYSCGINITGQLGHGNTKLEFNPSPIRFFKYKKIISIATGKYHSLFLDKNNNVYSCGNNEYGQLGHGSTKIRTLRDAEERYTPKRIDFFYKNKKKITSLSCGDMHSLFLDEAGVVYGCGQSDCGSIGDLPRPMRFVYEDRLLLANDDDIRITTIYCGGRSSFYCDKKGEIYSSANYSLGVHRTPPGSEIVGQIELKKIKLLHG